MQVELPCDEIEEEKRPAHSTVLTPKETHARASLAANASFSSESDVSFGSVADTGRNSCRKKKKPRRGGRGFLGFLWGNSDGEGKSIT
jgi:hypothetical protein